MRCGNTRGLTTTELVVTLCIGMAMVGISAVAIARVNKSRTQVVCAANLHTLSIAFANYASDYQDFFPAPTPKAQWEDLLRDYAPRGAFRCPADKELFPSLGSSYDWRDTGNSLTTLAGKTHMQIGRNDIIVAFDTLPGWHAPEKIQVLRADSTVLMVNQEVFFNDLQKPLDQ